MSRGPILVFSTDSHRYIAEHLCEQPGFVPGELEHRVFPDGEHYRRIITSCEGRDIALVGGTISELDTLLIYDLASALVDQGAHTLTLVIPYFGYQTMERAVRKGEIVAAKTRARLLSSIPGAGSGNRVILVDLHVETIAHYFSGNLRPLHLRATPLILDALRTLGGDDFVLGATDAGRAKWVESLANDLRVDAAFIFKRRLSGKETCVTAMSADVRGKKVVIYDDMIRTGGSLLGAAQAYLDSGATEISAVTTHGVFPGTSLERLRNSGLFASIVCTDSHPRARALADSTFLQVRPIAPLLAECLQRNR